MRLYISMLFVCVAQILHAQVGINTLAENAKAEFVVRSPNNDKGILLPRMTAAQMNAIAMPVEGLLVYCSDNNTFYYRDAAAWVRIGNSCTIIQDENGDTKIDAEKTPDDDIIRLSAKGIEVLRVGINGTAQLGGDLYIPNGTLRIGSAYRLPSTDGTNKYILLTDGSGVLSWRDPLSLPGLVAGIQTIPLGMGRESEALTNNAFLTVVIPWSTITIRTIAVLIKKTGSPTLEIGVFENSALKSSGTVTPTADGFVSVTLSTPVQLKAGAMYRFAILDQKSTSTSVLEYPSPNSLNWHYQAAASGIGPAGNQKLPALLGTASNGIQKSFWFCAY